MLKCLYYLNVHAVIIIVLFDLKYFSDNTSISNVFLCKLANKSYSCTFKNCNSYDQKTLLLSMAHQLCKISGNYKKSVKLIHMHILTKYFDLIIAENKKLTSNMSYIKQELNSFLENKKSTYSDEPEPTSSKENVLASFPLKNEDELLLIESKLKSEDLSFTNKLVCK